MAVVPALYDLRQVTVFLSLPSLIGRRQMKELPMEPSSQRRWDVPNRASQVALVVENLPANAGDIKDSGSVPGSGRSPALEKEMATHSSVLAWRIPWTEEPGKLQSMG